MDAGDRHPDSTTAHIATNTLLNIEKTMLTFKIDIYLCESLSLWLFWVCAEEFSLKIRIDLSVDGFAKRLSKDCIYTV